MNKFTVKKIILWNHATEMPLAGSYIFLGQDNIETKRKKLYRQVRQN